MGIALRPTVLASLGALLLLTGCIDVESSAGTETITYSGAVRAGVRAAALLCGASASACWWAVMRAEGAPSTRLGGVALVLTLLTPVALGVAASVLSARLVLTEEGVHDRAGFPWNRYWRGFGFDEVERVVVTERVVGWGRSRHEEDVWILHGTDGEQRILVPGDLWGHAYDRIAVHLQAHGVAVGPDVSPWRSVPLEPFMRSLVQEGARRVETMAAEGAPPND